MSDVVSPSVKMEPTRPLDQRNLEGGPVYEGAYWVPGNVLSDDILPFNSENSLLHGK